jgi:ABC-2 type transport system permease protein
MTLGILRAMASKEAKLVRRDSVVVVLLLIVPLFLVVLLAHGVIPLIDAHNAVVRPAGADFAVPAYTLVFGFFQLAFLGNAFINERVWGTWTRLLASRASASTVLLGKVGPYAVVSALQLAFLLALGRLALGMHLTGSLLALLLVGASIVSVIAGLGFLVAALCTSVQQVNSIGNVTVVFAALGGALLPLKALPHWVQLIAPAAPQYWAIKGLRSVILEGGGIGDVLPSALVLFGVAALASAVAIWRFRVTVPTTMLR